MGIYPVCCRHHLKLETFHEFSGKIFVIFQLSDRSFAMPSVMFCCRVEGGIWGRMVGWRPLDCLSVGEFNLTWYCGEDRPPLTAPSRHIVPIKTSRRSSAADEKKNLGDKMRPGWVGGEARERKREWSKCCPVAIVSIWLVSYISLVSMVSYISPERFQDRTLSCKSTQGLK